MGNPLKNGSSFLNRFKSIFTRRKNPVSRNGPLSLPSATLQTKLANTNKTMKTKKPPVENEYRILFEKIRNPNNLASKIENPNWMRNFVAEQQPPKTGGVRKTKRNKRSKQSKKSHKSQSIKRLHRRM
jgi:hypothetical protein